MSIIVKTINIIELLKDLKLSDRIYKCEGGGMSYVNVDLYPSNN